MAASLLAAAPATAVTIPGFDHARPVEPQHVEAGGAFAFGGDHLTAIGFGRIGLLDDLEAVIRAGFVNFSLPKSDDQNGFEIETGAKFRFLRQEDNYVDLAANATVSILKTADVFVLGLDPTVLVSHHFQIAPERELYVGAGVGTAMTVVDIDARHSDFEIGLLGAFSAGVDIIPRVRLSLEGRLRDDLERFGIAVSYYF